MLSRSVCRVPRHLISAFLVSSLVFALVRASAGEPSDGEEIEGLKMKLVRDLDRGFQLQLPGSPEKDIVRISMDDLTIDIDRYTVSLSRERNYILYWCELPERIVEKRKPHETIEAYRTRAIKTEGSQVRRQEVALEGTGTPGIEWEYEIDSEEYGKIHFREAIYLDGRRLYRIVCIGDVSISYCNATDYILQSFHLSNLRQEQHFSWISGNWTVLSCSGWHEPHRLTAVRFERDYYRRSRAIFEDDRPDPVYSDAVVAGGTGRLRAADLHERRRIFIVPEKNGGTIDVLASDFQRDVYRGIYRLQGTRMTICLRRGNDSMRPTDIDEEGDDLVKMQLKFDPLSKDSKE